MRIKRSGLLLSLVTILLILMLTVGISAEYQDVETNSFNITKEIYSFSPNKRYLTFSENDYLALDVDTEKLSNDIYWAYKRLENKIDISAYKISREDRGIISTVLRDCIADHPDLYYANGSLSLTISGSGICSTLELSYEYSQDDLAQVKYASDREIDNILATIPEDASDAEKALIVHDYFCKYYEYDYENLKNNTIPALSYKAGGLFMNKTGVCQAYALAYKVIMNYCGIDCTFVASDNMNHAWNQICIDNKWYNVDVTWDDPCPDMFASAYHKFFLLSDETMKDKDHNHYDWNSTHTCDSKDFEDKPWIDATYSVVFQNGYIYIPTGSGYLYKYDYANDKLVTLLTVSDIWFTSAEKITYYAVKFISIDSYGDCIYYSTPTSVIAYNVSTGSSYTVPLDDFNGQIYGIMIKDNNLYYNTCYKYDDEEQTIYTKNLGIVKISSIVTDFDSSKVPYGISRSFNIKVNAGADASRIIWTSTNENVASVTSGVLNVIGKGTATIRATSPDFSDVYNEFTVTASVLIGDFFADGEVNIKDAVKISQYLAKWSIDMNDDDKLAADVFKDGTVDIKDAVKLAQYLAKWNVQLGA